MDIINRIKITGYRSIRSLDLELTPFTVLVGANGAGKSNLVDFFRLLNSAFSLGMGNLQSFVARSGKASSLLYCGPKTTANIQCSVSLTDGRLYEFGLEWGAPDELFYNHETVSEAPENGIGSTSVSSGRHGESALLVPPDSAMQWAGTIDSFVYKLRLITTYHFHDTSSTAPVRISQNLNGPILLSHDAGNLSVFLRYLLAERPKHYRRILATIQLVAPFIRDFVVQPDTPTDQTVLLRWMDESGAILGPHQLSDGTIRAIALIAALLQPEEWMPSIMIFDEPELGLHPSAVDLVATLLKAASEKRQIIVATQSPALIRDYEPEDIVVAERMVDAEGRGESTFTRLDRASLRAWLEDYNLGELYEKNVTSGRSLVEWRR